MNGPGFVFCPRYEADIGGHVFPVAKYRLIREKLLAEGALAGSAFREVPVPDPDLPSLVHTPDYLADFRALRATPATLSSELPLTREIREWFELAVSGSVFAADLARDHGAAMHIGGGFHHAFADHAEGFCYLNDIAVAALDALANPGSGVRGVSVVDVDVHQGNGTARILARDPRVFTFSIHQENNYPVKERSNLDIGLPDGIGDAQYLEFLDRGLERSVLQAKPDLVYYVAGADPYREDRLGGLGLSRDGLQERDRRVFAACAGIGAKVVVLLAGGYAVRLQDTVAIHAAAGEEMLARWPLAGESADGGA
jgi:acetoin utilization deacetylase AcuC-like enzyme